MTSCKMINSYTDVSDIPLKRIYPAPYLRQLASPTLQWKRRILHIQLNYNLQCVKTIALTL